MRKLILIFALALGTIVQAQLTPLVGIIASQGGSEVDYGIENITYSGNSYSFVSDITTGIHLNWSGPNGDVLVGSATGYVQYAYTMTDDNDISTLSKGTDSYSYGLTTQAAWWVDNGDWMVSISNSNNLRSRSASTSYQLSSLSGSTTNQDLSSAPLGSVVETRGLAIRGGYVFVLCNTTDEVHRYSWTEGDVTSVTLLDEFDVSNEATNVQGIDLSPDGKTMLILDTSADDIIEYSLSTPWDVSTATYVRRTTLPGTCCGSVQYNTLIYHPDYSAVTLVAGNSEIAYQFNLNN